MTTNLVDSKISARIAQKHRKHCKHLSERKTHAELYCNSALYEDDKGKFPDS